MSRQLESLTLEFCIGKWPFVGQFLADNGLSQWIDRPESELSEVLNAELLVELNRSEQVTLVVVTHSTAIAARMGKVFNLSDGVLGEGMGE